MWKMATRRTERRVEFFSGAIVAAARCVGATGLRARH